LVRFAGIALLILAFAGRRIATSTEEDSVEFGIHLPQYGRAADADAIREAAQQAEALGFHDVWVSDHIGVPERATVSAYLYEPLVTLTWAAAVTTRVRLGTSVLVVPYRHPMHLAKELASLDRLSGGRLVVGVGPGWLPEEFEALGVPFNERGRRTDEGIAALRACWDQRVVDFVGETVRIQGMRVEPRPGRRIPIWVGGVSGRAIRRAVDVGDGWHAIGLGPADLRPLIAVVRHERPTDDFTVSLRVTWDGLVNDLDKHRQELDEYRAAGVQHIMAAPTQSDRDGWMRSVERLAQLFELGR
jgi:probable F420-dependent oxidoreductase